MDNLKDNVEDLIAHTGQYLEARKDLVMLNLTEKMAVGASKSASSMVIGALYACCALFLSIALALWLGNRLENSALGFALVALIYLIVTLIFTALRKPLIEDKLSNLIYQKYLDND